MLTTVPSRNAIPLAIIFAKRMSYRSRDFIWYCFIFLYRVIILLEVLLYSLLLMKVFVVKYAMSQERIDNPSFPFLELFQPRYEKASSVIIREIDRLGDISERMQKIYENYIRVDETRPIWDFTPSQISRDIVLEVHWPYYRNQPYSPNINALTSTLPWLNYLKSVGGHPGYFGDENDLWIPHNWEFMKKHFLPGGKIWLISPRERIEIDGQRFVKTVAGNFVAPGIERAYGFAAAHRARILKASKQQS